MAVGAFEGVTGVAHGVDAAIDGGLGVEDLVPRTGVPGKADTVLVRVPMAVACIDNHEEDVALGVVSFEGYDPVLAADVGDLAVGGAKAGVVPAKVVDVDDHALHGGADVVSDLEPVDAVVVAGTNDRVPEPVEMPFGSHEEHMGGGKGGAERPSELGFDPSIAVCSAAEAFGDVPAAVILAAIDLIVGAGEVGDELEVWREGPGDDGDVVLNVLDSAQGFLRSAREKCSNFLT